MFSLFTFKMSSDSGSLQRNPPNSQIHITNHTSDWLWAVFAIMLLSDLVFIFLSHRRPLGGRVFHQLPIIILTTATIAYFAMASDLGAAPVMVEFARGWSGGVPTRAIWVSLIFSCISSIHEFV